MYKFKGFYHCFPRVHMDDELCSNPQSCNGQVQMISSTRPIELHNVISTTDWQSWQQNELSEHLKPNQ